MNWGQGMRMGPVGVLAGERNDMHISQQRRPSPYCFAHHRRCQTARWARCRRCRLWPRCSCCSLWAVHTPAVLLNVPQEATGWIGGQDKRVGS